MSPVFFTRREVIRLLPAGAAAPILGALPAGCFTRDVAPVFFSDAERRELAALADHLLPPDHEPGGAALGAVEYIEGLLTALERSPPRFHAGGPFSGRQPHGGADGRPSALRPRNEFARFLQPTRVSLLAWRLKLHGSAGVPGGGPNDALLGPVEGLRSLFRRGLAAAMQSASAPLETLDPEARDRVWRALVPEFREALVELVLEAALAPPEYGGNRNLAGWRIAHFEGDSQPLGYSLFDETAGRYRERPEAPVSTASPGPDLDPMDAETRLRVEIVTRVLGGRVRP